MFFWNHIFVSQWNYTELVSNERGDQKDSISGLFWGKKYDKDRLVSKHLLFSIYYFIYLPNSNLNIQHRVEFKSQELNKQNGIIFINYSVGNECKVPKIK